MVDVTFGDKDGRFKNDHFCLNFGLDRIDEHTWDEELFLSDGFERYTDDAFTYYNGNSGYCACSMADAAELCNSLAKGGKRKAEILVFQTGIWEKEIEAALGNVRPKRNWRYSCFRHDMGVVISVWW